MFGFSEIPMGLKIYLSIVAFAFGTVFGSFCNAWAWRMVHNEKISKGRSHCPKCGHTLAAKDLVPIFSWLLCKGKCRYCGEPISIRYFLTESLLGVYFLSIFLVYGVSLATIRFWALGSIMLVMSLQDLDTMEMEDSLQIAAAGFVLLRIGEKGFIKDALLGLIVAAVMLAISLISEKILAREAMGGADIKLMAVLGIHLGPLKMVYLLILACVIGLVGAVITKKGFGKEFPFGPALALAAWITILSGTTVVNAYLSLL